MAILLAFAVNAGLNFALGLLVAHFLGPASFGRYAIAFAGAIVVNTFAFEWLRLSATRFYTVRTRAREPWIRRALDVGYAGVVALILLAAALLGLAGGVDGALRGIGGGGGRPGIDDDLVLAAAALVVGVGMGLFDFQGALARALFRGGAYGRLVMVRNAAALVLIVGVAAWWRAPVPVLLGTAASAIGAAVLMHRRLADPPGATAAPDGIDAPRDPAEFEPLRAGPAIPAGAGAPRRDVRSTWRIFAGYALPLVAANLLYQSMPLASRAVLAGRDGFAEAGYFSLAADLGLRLFLALGTALDLVLFQAAVRAEEEDGPAAGEAQVARNLVLVVAVLLPFAALLWAATPALEALVVPAAFRGPFATYFALLLPGLLALALVNYALNPLFQLRRRTAPVIAAALVGVVAGGSALVVLPGLVGPAGAALAQVAGVVTALAVLAGRALVGPARLRPSWRDLAGAAGATLAATLAVLPLRHLEPPLLGLVLTGIVGGGVYAGLAWWLDLAGLRGLAHTHLVPLARRLRERPRRPGAPLTPGLS